MEFSPEFRLAADCCRWNFGGRGGPRPTVGDVDWSRFVRLVCFHRVQGLVWNCLTSGDSAPHDVVFRKLSVDAAEIAALGLRQTAECARLSSTFENAGLQLRFVKGLTLGALAYGHPIAKGAIDIDVVVSSDELAAVSALLVRCGYSVTLPTGGIDHLQQWHESHKESVWRSPSEHLQVDVHTRLADNPRLIPSIGSRSPSRMVPISDSVELPTLGADELFAYLAVHGASSAWFRLKWISDFAALLVGADIKRLYRHSQELGAGRAAAQALLLADRLFQSLDQAPDLRIELAKDRMSVWLYRAALRQLAGSTEPIEPTGRPWGTWRIHATQFLLQPGLRYKLSEFSRQLQAMLN